MNNAFWFLAGMAANESAKSSPELSNLPLKDQLLVTLISGGILLVLCFVAGAIVGLLKYWTGRKM